MIKKNIIFNTLTNQIQYLTIHSVGDSIIGASCHDQLEFPFINFFSDDTMFWFTKGNNSSQSLTLLRNYFNNLPWNDYGKTFYINELTCCTSSGKPYFKLKTEISNYNCTPYGLYDFAFITFYESYWK